MDIGMRVGVLSICFGIVTGAQAPQTVLFVCEHGTAKSVVAAAHFNKLAAEKKLALRAESRGTAPDPAVPQRIVAGLKGEGLSLPAGFTPAPVSAKDVAGAARVVTFDVSLPATAEASSITRWNGLPALSDGFGPANAAIKARVEALINELEAAKKPR